MRDDDESFESRSKNVRKYDSTADLICLLENIAPSSFFRQQNPHNEHKTKIVKA